VLDDDADGQRQATGDRRPVIGGQTSSARSDRDRQADVTGESPQRMRIRHGVCHISLAINIFHFSIYFLL